MATLRDRIKAFLNPLPVATEQAGEVAPVIPESFAERFQVETTRAAIVKDCRTMYDSDPRVEKMHRDYARDLVRNGFMVQTKDARAKEIADALHKRLGLNQRLEDWLRLSMRDGDSFLELTIDEGQTQRSAPTGSDLIIANVTRKPTLQMHRNSNAADMFDNPERAFWMGDTVYAGQEPPKTALWFPEWKMLHARWNHDEEKRYGRPMMQSARKHYKYVEDGELNVAVRRKIGGGQIRSHFIEGSPADVEKYKEDNKAAIGKLAAVIDLFSNKKGTLEVHQGDGNIDKIADVEHHIATMFTASDEPMELIAYGGGLNRDILGEKKDQYDEILNQGREWATMQIVQPLLERQWLLQGILPATLDYKIIWRKARSLTPESLRNLGDGMMRLRLLGVKDEVISTILASFLRDVDAEILDGSGIDSERFAQMLQGLSI